MPAPLFIAGASVRAAAQSAVRAGCVVTAADIFGDQDLAAIAVAYPIADYPGGIPAIADAVPAMEWMYTGGLENYPDVVDAISRRHRLLGNPGMVLRQARNPWELAAALQQAGLLVPCPYSELPRILDGRWLIKPLAGSGGGRIRELLSWARGARGREPAERSHDAVRESATSAPRRAPVGWYFQRWIRGRSLSAVYVAEGGRAKLLCVTRQLVGCAWAGSRGFEYVGSIGPLTLSTRLQRAYASIGYQLAKRWGLCGLFGVDTVVAGDAVWTLEVNPRYPASVEVWERATGASSVACHRAACNGSLPADNGLPPARRMVGKAIVNAPIDVVLDAPTGQRLLGQIPGGLGQLPGGPGLADLPRLGQPIPSGSPVFTVFAEGADYRATYRQLRTRAEQLRATLRHR